MAEPHHGSFVQRGLHTAARNRQAEGRFGFMFKDLEPFRPPENLLLGLAETMRQPAANPQTQFDNPDTPAGFTFFGQFVDHDLTLDSTSQLGQQSDPEGLVNFRTPIFDLDSVYGGGPTKRPDLYDGAKLRLATREGIEDMLRKPDGTADIPEARNEENLIIAQLQIAMIKFANRMVDHVAQSGASGPQVFEKAQRLAQHYYQWVVLTDFLPRICGQDVVDSLFKKPSGNSPMRVELKFYKPKKTPFMPVEFSGAAYRFGHSQIRPGYRMNAQRGAAFFQPAAGEGNLNGFRPIPPSLKIEWPRFFDVAGSGETPQQSLLIDIRLSPPLFDLPFGDPPKSLAARNLLRGITLGLPSGQAVAEAMEIKPLPNSELGIPDEAGWENQAPLWYYVLKEAELQHGGRRLGEVGARIVAETFLGILAKHDRSFFSQDRNFRPQPPIAPAEGTFKMGDLLRFAGAA